MIQDFRSGIRLLWHARNVSVLALLALGLGIGASVAIFSVVDVVLLKPLPFRDADRLLAIYEKNPSQHKFQLFVAPANFHEWQRLSRSVEAMAAIADTRMNLEGDARSHADAEELKAERVSAELFSVLGVQPVVGRAFLPEEDQPGHNNFALLSYRLWQSRFHGDPQIGGKTIRLVAAWQRAAGAGDQNYTVVGVLPAGFSVLTPDVDVFVPLGLAPNDPSRRLVVIGRLQANTSLQQADAEMAIVGDSLERQSPELDRGWRPDLSTLKDQIVGDVRRPLLVLLAAVGLLLAIACANVANLLLARGAGRRREIAIRLAMGATRARVARQMIIESVVLALAGGVLGLWLAQAAVAVVARLGAGRIPRLAEAGVDARLLLFALGVSILTGILFGAAPALQASDFDLSEALAEGGRGGTLGRAGRALRSALVVVEIGLALVVLIGASLLVRSFEGLRAARCGFNPAGVLTFRVPLAGGRNFTRERAAAFFKQLGEQLAVVPGVRSVGAIDTLPLTGFGAGSTVAVDGRPVPAVGERPLALARYIERDYFRVLGIPLVAGRLFAESDNTESPPVCLVNQMLARRFWPDSNPLGGRLVLFDLSPRRICEIVGVVGDTRPDRIQDADWPTFYVSNRQISNPAMVITVRTAGSPLAAAAAVQNVVRQLDPDQPIADLRTMEDVVDGSVSDSRFNALLLAVFGAISFALATVGIYGVVSYDVGARAHEFGIRMAMGAGRQHVLGLVLRHVAGLAGLGIAIGLAAAAVLTRLMSAMLYGVRPHDVATYAVVSFSLAVVALAAGYVPARRALALDPVAALRQE